MMNAFINFFNPSEDKLFKRIVLRSIEKHNGKKCDLSDLGLSSEELERIFSMRELEVFFGKINSLDLSGNKITYIPNNLCKLINLKELNLSRNEIRYITDRFRQLINLKELSLHSNKLIQIPDSISGLVSLEKLGLRDNQVTQIPDSISGLVSLKELLLDYNRINQIPESISYIPALRMLNLQNNPLTQETMNFLQSLPNIIPSLYVIFNMASHDALIGYDGVLSQTNFHDNYEVRALINQNPALQEFLSKSSPLNSFRVEALNYLLEKLQNSNTSHQVKEALLAQVVGSCGDCGTPVKDALLQMYIKSCTEQGREVSDALILKAALSEWINNNRARLNLGFNEEIEQKHGLLNALFLKNAALIADNKIKIDSKNIFNVESDTNYINFSFNMVNAQSVQPFAKAVCKTNQQGELVKNSDGYYVADEEKLHRILEDYKVTVLGMKNSKHTAIQKTLKLIQNEMLTKYEDIMSLPLSFVNHQEELKSMTNGSVDYSHVCRGYATNFFDKCKFAQDIINEATEMFPKEKQAFHRERIIDLLESETDVRKYKKICMNYFRAVDGEEMNKFNIPEAIKHDTKSINNDNSMFKN